MPENGPELLGKSLSKPSTIINTQIEPAPQMASNRNPEMLRKSPSKPHVHKNRPSQIATADLELSRNSPEVYKKSLPEPYPLKIRSSQNSPTFNNRPSQIVTAPRKASNNPSVLKNIESQMETAAQNPKINRYSPDLLEKSSPKIISPESKTAPQVVTAPKKTKNNPSVHKNVESQMETTAQNSKINSYIPDMLEKSSPKITLPESKTAPQIVTAPKITKKDPSVLKDVESQMETAAQNLKFNRNSHGLLEKSSPKFDLSQIKTAPQIPNINLEMLEKVLPIIPDEIDHVLNNIQNDPHNTIPIVNEMLR